MRLCLIASPGRTGTNRRETQKTVELSSQLGHRDEVKSLMRVGDRILLEIYIFPCADLCAELQIKTGFPGDCKRNDPHRPRQRKMILTNCAACAAPLAHNAPRCVRCKSRYCNRTCQMDHWRRGHKQMCKKIHRGGNAEQCHADKKYKEAVAEAVEMRSSPSAPARRPRL